jgi:hypothetical protein
MDDYDSAARNGADSSDAGGGAVQHGLIGMVRGEDVHIQQSGSVVTTARGAADVHQSASVAMVSGGDTSFTMSAAVVMPTLGDVRIDKGAAQWVIAAGDVSFDKGGCAAVVSPSVHVERGGVGLALARHVEIGDGGRVLLGPLAAAALGLGLALGMGLAVAASAGYVGVKAWQRRPGGAGLP